MATASEDTGPVEVTQDLLLKYDRPGPRYTSYPTAPEWSDEFGSESYRSCLQNAALQTDTPLSLYVHVPFCQERCHFCGCNVVISKHQDVTEAFLDHVGRELALTAQALGDRRRLMQLHWGGGTPTYLSCDDIRTLFGHITEHFELDPNAEIAIEADPRVTTHEQVALLVELGFNRISMGVQDLDPLVQKAIQRNQTEEETRQLVTWCREGGFKGINIDLIYGLPEQTLDGWEKTVASIIDIHPDRLAVYSYAHLPAKIKHQAKMDVSRMPAGPEKYELFALARRMFTDASYRAIGMDHFAAPEDELTAAIEEHRLHRNFMGYTVVPAADMIGVGPSAIGEIGGCYAQNHKRLVYYYRAVDEGLLPTSAGCTLSEDDKIRSWVIRQIMCNFYLDTSEFASRFGVEFSAYFAEEEKSLAEFEEEGFVAMEDGNMVVRPLGQAFVRNIAMVFDAYLETSAFKSFSRTV